MRQRLNLTKVPIELKLIISLVKCETPDQVENIDLSLFYGVNWDFFIKQARHHRIYPVLYKKLQWCSSELVPEHVVQTVAADYKRNTFQMLHLSNVMGQLSKLFSAKRLQILFLKGPQLALDLYGDLSLRTSNDLDVLVPINQLPEAEKLLLDLGYQKDDYIETILNDWKWRHHHVTYIHPVTGVKVEVHWRLNPGPGKEPGFLELWARKRNMNLSKHPIHVLGKEDLFVFLSSHGARHGWSRLRWIVDIHQLMKMDLDWEEAYKLLNKYGNKHTGFQALQLAEQLFHTSSKALPKQKTNKSRKLAQQAVYYLESMINLHSEPLDPEVAKYHKRHLFGLMTFQQRVYFILSFLYPYPQDAQTLPLPKSLHFLYFPLRPFIWGWRKTRRLV
ncbi:nucleotidyltransferase domain-containing protein [Halobacillus andaensis]|uniref:nucleotidyltransferase domain-containing protein n=1 Tax=Halobacillus andaensis TaxID=1176239 RepID=UPI003D75C870